jgi:hypothetical protein
MHAFNIYSSLIFLVSITYLSMITEKQWGLNAHRVRCTKRFYIILIVSISMMIGVEFFSSFRTVRVFLQSCVNGPLQEYIWNRWIMNWYNDLGIFSYVWNDTGKHLFMYDVFLRSRKGSKFSHRSSRIKCPLNS